MLGVATVEVSILKPATRKGNTMPAATARRPAMEPPFRHSTVPQRASRPMVATGGAGTTNRSFPLKGKSSLTACVVDANFH